MDDRIQLTRLAVDDGFREQLAIDARKGLTAPSKTLPPKYFYDARGSQLFEAITRLPEYYQTRTETRILAVIADAVIAAVRPGEIVEIGSGASRKTRLLLEAMRRAGTGDRYVAFDVSEDALLDAARILTRDYPWLHVHGVVGDFDLHLRRIPRPVSGRRLVVFLGSTLGNLHPDERIGFLHDVAALLDQGDAFLLGVDLVKDVDVLEAAYDDAQGVTAEFNRNVLAVLNHELGADFPLDAFTHVARYRTDRAWIEMALRAQRDLVVHIDALDMDVTLTRGEEIRTEISCKFTHMDVAAMFADAGLRLAAWHTDADQKFALALAQNGIPI
ncbi:MAG: L-histidine N(alpha)-methyltransferase [Egibacteraceae bacterium]